MNCIKCLIKEVEVERVEIGLEICLDCAKKVPKVKGYMSFQHKTAPVVQIVHDWKEYSKYAPHGRNTGRGSGVHRMSPSRK